MKMNFQLAATILAFLLLLSSPAAATEPEHLTRAPTQELSFYYFSPHSHAVRAGIAPGHSNANCRGGIPEQHCEAAAYVYRFARSHNFAPPPGYKGGSPYRNETGKLPAGGDYLEYRIYTTPGSSERLVLDRNDSGSAWFTPDHYTTFMKFWLIVPM